MPWPFQPKSLLCPQSSLREQKQLSSWDRAPVIVCCSDGTHWARHHSILKVQRGNAVRTWGEICAGASRSAPIPSSQGNAYWVELWRKWLWRASGVRRHRQWQTRGTRSSKGNQILRKITLRRPKETHVGYSSTSSLEFIIKEGRTLRAEPHLELANSQLCCSDGVNSILMRGSFFVMFLNCP